jgi:ABC-type polysaccharide/polyol phosphate transport system ATPase subunit
MIVVEGVSKRYPREPVTIFPPVVSMFGRDLFRRRRATNEAGRPPDEAAPGSQALAPDGDRPKPQRRDREFEDDDLEDDDLEDDDDDDDEGFARPGGPTPDNPGEMFWALKDVSFRVPRGAALGIVGEADAGKTTLLRIIAGQSLPTEGRVLIRDRVSPLPDALAKALNFSSKGTHNLSLTMGARLLGVERHLVKRHEPEIAELAGPDLEPDAQPTPAALIRLAVATAVVLPTNVLLLDDLNQLEDDFVERVLDRVRKRLQRGSSLVLASRDLGIVEQLCDEALLLDGGSIVHPGEAKGVPGSPAAARAGRADAAGAGRGRGSGTPASGRRLPPLQALDVPRDIPPFHASAALLSATLGTATGRSKRIDATADEVTVEIRLETAVHDVEAHCGVSLVPRGGAGTGLRIELPEPRRFAQPGTYVLIARALPGALRSGAYVARADAIIASPREERATVIARDIGRVRILGDDPGPGAPAAPSITHWDGREMWQAEAEWSIEPA